MSYRIKRVAHLTGINPATLRAWERRYHLISPRRTPAGYRVYSDEDVALLTRIKRLTDEGLSIGEAIARVRRGTRPLAGEARAAAVDDARREQLDPLPPLAPAAARAPWERVSALPAERLTEEVLMPLLREVGDLWEHGSTGVAEEHFASAFVREKLVAMREELDTGASGPVAVLAGLPGERHELGMLGAAVHVAAAGWKVVYLGLEVPFDELKRILECVKPALLCTSVLRPMRNEEFRRLAREVRALAPEGTEVVVGGGGVPPGNEKAVPGVRLVDSFSEIFAPA